jgi:hypothetical protein
LRLEVLILYFWAFIHKFNTGFFDKVLSCPTVQVFNVNEILPIVPSQDWFLSINPYLTVVVEGSIPLLLIIPYTRAFGIIVGIAFHFILGFRYPGFTVLAFALYAVFIPEASYVKVRSEFGRYKNRLYSLISPYSSYFEWKKKSIDSVITQSVLIIAIIELMGFFMRGGIKEHIIISRVDLHNNLRHCHISIRIPFPD